MFLFKRKPKRNWSNMPRKSNKIHPNARIWIITTLVLGVALVLKTESKVIQTVQPQGRLVAYYTNDYQRYAIDRLTEMNRLREYPCLYELWSAESNWRPEALNKSSKAFGIAQLKPMTWDNLKIKPTNNGYSQVDAGLIYINQHYGKTNSICKAYAHHLAMGWY